MALYKKDGQFFFDSELVSHISRGENDKIRPFLDSIAHPRALRNSLGNTLLHIAARYGNAMLAEYLIDWMGFEVDAHNNLGVAPLDLAVEYAHADTVSVLLDAKADVYDAQYRDDCLLQVAHDAHMAGRKPVEGRARIMRLFAKRVCWDFWDEKELTRAKLWDSRCSLHCLVVALRDPKLVRWFVERGLDVDAPEPYSQCTALHAAVGGTNLPVVRVLVEYGAKVNALDRFGRTPLFYYNCHSRDPEAKLEMLEYLIKSGASLTVADAAGCTLLEWLLTHMTARSVERLLRVGEVDLTASYRFGKTPLHFLASNSSRDVMRALGGKQFDVDAREENGNTPLLVAVSKMRNLGSVEFLVDNGADVNAESDGQTPLCLAVTLSCNRGKSCKLMLQIIELLLLRGANVQHVFDRVSQKKKANERMNLFDWVVSNGQFETSKLLIGQLVLDDVKGEAIADLIREKYESNEVLNQQFNMYKEQIEKIKAARINDTLTLFELMTEKEENLLVRVMNSESLPKLGELMNDILPEKAYYVEVIKKRVASIIKKSKLMTQ